jgi:hypothetical protein
MTFIVDEAVNVLTNTLVVVSALADYTFKKEAVFEPAIEP